MFFLQYVMDHFCTAWNVGWVDLGSTKVFIPINYFYSSDLIR